MDDSFLAGSPYDLLETSTSLSPIISHESHGDRHVPPDRYVGDPPVGSTVVSTSQGCRNRGVGFRKHPQYSWKWFIPRCSMYGIFTYIWVILGVNVGKYSIHGASGIWYTIGLGLIVVVRLLCCPKRWINTTTPSIHLQKWMDKGAHDDKNHFWCQG